MFNGRVRGRLALSGVAALAGLAIAASGASAHTGGSNCNGTLAEDGYGLEGSCEFPFQGFPIGVAGVNKAGEPGRGTDIHVEVLAKVTGAPARPLGIECLEYGPADESRCLYEHNPLTAPVTAFEPMPSQIATLICSAHSHANYSRKALPTGRFACWSTDEAREDLERDGVMAEIGY